MENDKKKHVLKLLLEAEQKLQQVITETAMAGDYGTSRLTSEVAKQIQQLKSDLTATATHETVQTQRPAATPKRTTKRRRAGRRKPQYPQFEIRNNVLVRIGWSKKEKKEYNHKAQRLVYDKTIAAMETVSRSSIGPVMAEQIIENLNETDSDAPPNYQVYLVIGFLREFSCIKQVGREGYEITPELKERADSLWRDICDGTANHGG